MRFDFYYKGEEQQFNFLQVPKALFSGSFKNLSNDIRMLYAFLRERMLLSMKNGWFDPAGAVYIIYTIEDIMDDMGISRPSAVNYLKKLEEAGLIIKKRQGQGLPSLIYVMNFQEPFSKEPDKEIVDKPSEVKNINYKKLKNLTSESKDHLLQEVKKTDSNNTKNIKTNYNQNNNLSIDRKERSIDCKSEELMDSTNPLSYEQLIKENIGYEKLTRFNARLDKQMENGQITVEKYENDYIDISYVNMIINYMIDIVSSKSEKPVCINGENIPKNWVRKRLLSVNDKAVIECAKVLKHEKAYIRNPKNYAISVLYNSRVA